METTDPTGVLALIVIVLLILAMKLPPRDKNKHKPLEFKSPWQG
jgi:hypothetical protein